MITANQDIGKEAAEVFAALLKGETVEHTNLLLVAPKCLQNRILDMIEEEIAHVKLNSQELFYAMAYSNAEKTAEGR